MLKSSLGYQGGITAPQKTAALAGYEILKAGGTAIEAIVAAAATIAVTYPHMNGIGGDAFWLVKRQNEAPIGISGCGISASLADIQWYKERGIVNNIPSRGGLSALTVPGALASWEKALSLVSRPIPLSDLFANSISYAKDGFAVTANQSECTASKLKELNEVNGFSETFLINRNVPDRGMLLKQSALKNTLESLAKDGLRSFYTGDLAKTHADYLSKYESPLRLTDFNEFESEFVEPLMAKISKGKLYNLPPPTQVISSLMILALFDKLETLKADSFEHIHALVEITKQVFIKRNKELGDPNYMKSSAKSWLN